MTHICVSKLSILGSDNGLSPGRRQTIIWTNAGILLIRTLGTNFSEIFGKIRTFSFKKMNLKMSSAKWRPSCLGLNVLRICADISHESCVNHTTKQNTTKHMHILCNNIKRHTALTIVSWPNPKLLIIVHTFYLMMIVRQSNIFSQPSRGNWVNWKHTAPYIE